MTTAGGGAFEMSEGTTERLDERKEELVKVMLEANSEKLIKEELLICHMNQQTKAMSLFDIAKNGRI